MIVVYISITVKQKTQFVTKICEPAKKGKEYSVGLTPNKYIHYHSDRPWTTSLSFFYNRFSSNTAKINHFDLAVIMLCISFLTAENLEIAVCYVHVTPFFKATQVLGRNLYCTQGVNTSLFCAGTYAMVPWRQVWEAPYKL